MSRLILTVLLALLSAPVSAQELSADEAAVWSLEEAYWRHVEANDLESYRALWDERFVGWPGGSLVPVEKDKIADWIAPLHSDPGRMFRSDIKREAVRSFGDVVVTHYSYSGQFIRIGIGEILEQWAPGKMTHTWQRQEDGGWKIITGMAGRIIDGSDEWQSGPK